MMRWRLGFLFLFCFLAFHAVRADNSEDSKESKESKEAKDAEVECHYDGKTYKYGERIITEKVCFHCTCREGWTEPSSSQCAIIDCPWGYYRNRPHCQQEYVEGQCCPQLKCSPAPPRMDPAYLSGKKLEISTDKMTISAITGSEIMMYCVIENEDNEKVDVKWTRKTPDGKEEPIQGNDNVVLDDFNNNTWALLINSVNESNAGSYICHIATTPPQEQITVVEIVEAPSFKNPACRLPPRQAMPQPEDPGKTLSCEINASEWGWFYNPETFFCEEHPQPHGCFTPTANNFATREECWANCGNACYDSDDAGECFAQIPRYFYDHPRDTCHKFLYNGCRGNRNNFQSREECENKCAAVKYRRTDGMPSPSNKPDHAPETQCTMKCPWNTWTHYLALKCRPIIEEDACCPTRFDCADSGENVPEASDDFTCIYEGKNYTKDEDIDLSDSCQVCPCTPSFKGPGSPGCHPIKECDIEEIQKKMEEGCVPIYQENKCCPVGWHCPIKKTQFRQQGPKVFHKEPSELNCKFAGIEYPRPHELITNRGFCMTCACLTPPYFTCEEVVCPPAPSQTNETLRCKEQPQLGQCCPEYKCWSILKETDHVGPPQTDKEKAVCEKSPCDIYEKCVMNYTQCQLEECERICEKCAVPSCIGGPYINLPNQCPRCGGYRTPEEACETYDCPMSSQCIVDEEQCRSGPCTPSCKMQNLQIIVPRPQLSLPEESKCATVMCNTGCKASPPNEQGCSESCICPKTAEEACKDYKCPSDSHCEGDCKIKSGLCIPMCVREARIIV